MGQYTSYWLYQRFEQRGSQDPIPTYPNTYSINGDGTMPLVVRNEDDTECGYVPPVEPTYRWTNIPITQDYICDECGYVPPTEKKLVAYYSDGKTLEVECNSSTELTSGETKPSGYEYSAMTSAVIGQCVNIIDFAAFYNCVGLSSITISNSVTSIGNYAFNSCSGLTNIDIPNSVITIGQGAFSLCKSLTSVTIPNSVTSIGNGAFGTCYGLTSVTIPNSVISIGSSAFSNCSGLTSVTVEATTPPTLGASVFYNTPIASGTGTIYVPCESVDAYKSAENWSTYADRIQGIPPCEPDPQYRWVNMDASVDYYCEGTTKYYKQKQQVSNDGGQTWIDVTPPVYQRGGVAEEQSTDCGYVPPTPTNKKLVATYTGGTSREVECNSNTLTTGDTSSYGYPKSAMTSAVIGQCVNAIGERAFGSCTNLKSVTIPDSVTEIGEFGFANCSSLTSIDVPDSVTSIGHYTFKDCTSLTSATIGTGIKEIGYEWFNGCTSLTSIGSKGSGASIEIPDRVETIDVRAFSACTSLARVIIPSGITFVSSSAFNDCNNLTSITVDNGNGVYDSRNNCNAIIKTDTNTLIVGCKTTTIPNSVVRIGEYAFANCTSFTDINIPNSVTEFGGDAFNGCTSLTRVNSNIDGECNIPNSVTKIGGRAFWGCNFTNINIPNSVTSIGSSAFTECRNITSVTIPNTVTYIGANAFINCTSLLSIVIPNSITEIGTGIFLGCTSLTSVTIPSSVTSIGRGAFARCTSLPSIKIPSAVRNIGENAFRNCTSLISVICLGTTPPALETYVFNNNAEGRKIYVPAESVDRYKSAINWKTYANNIEPIP